MFACVFLTMRVMCCLAGVINGKINIGSSGWWRSCWG